MSPRKLPTAAEVLAEAYDLVDSDPVRAGVLLGIARELREGSRPAENERRALRAEAARWRGAYEALAKQATDRAVQLFGSTLDGAPAYLGETATQRVDRVAHEATEQFPRLWLNTLQTEAGPRPSDLRFGEYTIPAEQITVPKIADVIAQSPAQGECWNCSQDVYEAAIFSPEGGSTTEWRHRATGQRACVFPESVDVKTEADPAA